MTARISGRGWAIFAAVVAVAAISAPTALAASPKSGYHYAIEKINKTTSVTVIGMQADSGSLISISGSSPKCQDKSGFYKGFAITKTVDVNSKGKFSFKGKASDLSQGPGGKKFKVKLKGKFKSSKKATGSYSMEGCPGKVKFSTKYSSGG